MLFTFDSLLNKLIEGIENSGPCLLAQRRDKCSLRYQLIQLIPFRQIYQITIPVEDYTRLL